MSNLGRPEQSNYGGALRGRDRAMTRANENSSLFGSVPNSGGGQPDLVGQARAMTRANEDHAYGRTSPDQGPWQTAFDPNDNPFQPVWDTTPWDERMAALRAALPQQAVGPVATPPGMEPGRANWWFGR
jgi:hypothetical protein